MKEKPKWISPANPLSSTERYSCFHLTVMVLTVCSLTFCSLHHHVADDQKHDSKLKPMLILSCWMCLSNHWPSVIVFYSQCANVRQWLTNGSFFSKDQLNIFS